MSQGTVIGIDQLVLGATAACDLVDLDNRLAVPTGTAITPQLLSHLKAAGVIGLIAKRLDFACHHFIPRIQGPEIVTNRIPEMRKRSGISDGLSQSTASLAKSVLTECLKQIARGSLPDMRSLDAVVERILHDTELAQVAPAPIDRTGSDNLIDRLVCKGMNMAVLISWHLRRDGADPALVRDAALGALLHDTGMVFVPRGVLESLGSLTPSSAREMRRHPYLAVRALSPLGAEIPDIAQEVILLHHEREDGNGYPLKKSGDRIPPAAQLAHVLDAYIALVSIRPHRPALTPHRAVEVLLSEANSSFNSASLRRFIAHTGRYPVGCTVLLSSNEVGIVVGVGKSGPFRPIVDVYFSRQNQFSHTPRRVDLGRETINYIRQVIQ